jgi:hypothetical protein
MAEEALKKSEEHAIQKSAERPSFIPKSQEGTEHITNADLQIPRIVLVQKMSPEVDDSEPARRIEGLKVGDMFNGLTHEIYGRGPLRFVILRADPPRFVEFIPREEGGGVKDPNVPPNDPRTQFGKDGSKPEATKFYDYVVLLLPLGDDPLSRMVALSFKSTGLKIAKQLNALIKLRNAAVYAGVYTLTSVDTQNSLGKFAIFQVQNAGWVEDAKLYEQLGSLSEMMKNKKIDIEREPGDETDIPIDADEHQESNVGRM